jgi:NADH:ubiquinone oxidoreductase subunit 3 (subunit A)
MNADILLSPPIAFLLAVAIAYGVYFFGVLIGERSQPTPGKVEPYACGEEFAAEKFAIGYRRFFIGAIFFTVMHVAVLTIATVPDGPFSWRALGYLLVIFASVSALYSDFD